MDKSFLFVLNILQNKISRTYYTWIRVSEDTCDSNNFEMDRRVLRVYGFTRYWKLKS